MEENALICSQDIDEDGIIQDVSVSKGTAPDVTCSMGKGLKKKFLENKEVPFLLSFLPSNRLCSYWEHFLVLTFSYHLCKMHPLRSYEPFMLESVHIEES